MRRALGLLLFGGLLFSQNPYYLKTAEEGRRAMLAKDWALASDLLEISAFGFLDSDAHLAQALVQLTYASYRAKQPERMKMALQRLHAHFGESLAKPEAVSVEEWQVFLLLGQGDLELLDLLQGATPQAMESYLERHPAELRVWRQYLPLAHSSDRWDKIFRKWLNRLSGPVAEEMLLFLVVQGNLKDCRMLADALVRLNAQNSLANEFLGNRAVEARNFVKARDHYALVTEWRLEESTRHRKSLPNQSLPSAKQESAAGEPEEPTQVPGKSVRSTSSSAPQGELDPSRQKKGEEIRALMAKGDLKAAAESLRLLGQENPSDVLYIELYAEYCHRKGDFKLLIETLSSLQTRTARSKFYLAAALLEEQHFEEAGLLLSELDLKEFPELPVLRERSEAGRRALRQGLENERDALAAQLKEAKDQERWQRFIYLLMELGDWKAAEQEIQSYRAAFGGPAANYFKARLELQRGQFGAAASQFSDLANGGFTSFDTFFFGGMAFLRAGNFPLADYMLQRAHKDTPGRAHQIQVMLEQIRKRKSP
jgi:hypothetical protein